jgi:hypothetical protein
MIMRVPDWTTLNAYVDGELDPAAAAAVADVAGRDPAIARQIADLYRLKGASHTAMAEPLGHLGNVLPKRQTSWVAAVAACLLAAVVIGTALWAMLPPGQPPALPANLLAQARTLHADWLAAETRSEANTPPAVLLAALTAFGAVPVMPDLRSTDLNIDLVKVANGPGGRVLQVGYRGDHGCHLSLFAFVDQRLPETAVVVRSGDASAYGWRVGQLGYLLYAVGMDPTRLALIADTVETATRARAPLGFSARQRLAENKLHSATCHA